MTTGRAKSLPQRSREQVRTRTRVPQSPTSRAPDQLPHFPQPAITAFTRSITSSSSMKKNQRQQQRSSSTSSSMKSTQNQHNQRQQQQQQQQQQLSILLIS